jgi:hypothetical protein
MGESVGVRCESVRPHRTSDLRLKLGDIRRYYRAAPLALAAAKEQRQYLQAQFCRLKARRGPKKAFMAVVASIRTAIYHILKDGTTDLGCEHLKRHSTDQQEKRLVKRLSEFGYGKNSSPSLHSLWHCQGRCGPVLPTR